MKKSQHQFVIDELKANGRISRNYALNLYHVGIRPSITKLATLISDLRLKQGWNIERRTEIDSNGNKDEVYYVLEVPQSAKVAKAIEVEGKSYLVYQ
mgnify:FL=1